jgi:uncharacterized protein (TIGR03083 family)
MVPERDVDCGLVYEEQRHALLTLLRSCGDAELRTIVPATPAWTVSDVLSHVVGIAADLNAGNLGGEDPDGWTVAQVSSRQEQTIEERAAEWDRESPAFEDGLRLLGYEIGSHFVGDLLHHASDVRHALGAPPIPDDEALAVGRDFYLVSFEQSLIEHERGSVDVTVGPEQWHLGSGTTVARLSATRYEVFRTLGGRRSETQIRALDWSGDLDAILPVVSRYPLPERPITDDG